MSYCMLIYIYMCVFFLMYIDGIVRNTCVSFYELVLYLKFALFSNEFDSFVSFCMRVTHTFCIVVLF